MFTEHLTFLCLSFRGCERVSTDTGTRLDTLRHRESAFDALVAGGWPAGQAPAMAERARAALMGARSTAIFHAQFGRLFSRARVIDELPDEVIALKVDRTQGHFRVVAAVLAHSACGDLDGVEGDDLVLVLALRPTPEAATQRIDGRFASQQALHDCLAGWRWAWPRAGTAFSERFRPGMYIVPGDPVGPAGADVAADEWVAQACATAYFFYCWLVCQRIERNLLAVSVNGDWDEEFRRLLLVKKQVVAARKTALLKNRAFPGSALLEHIFRCLEVFRLEMQLAYLTEQAEETTKALEMQNAYITSARIKSIEMIVFVSTILGLALAVNALQMKPFYDEATDNALSRPIFWWVFAVIIGAGIVLWGVLTQWSRTRKIVRWLKKRLSSRTEP